MKLIRVILIIEIKWNNINFYRLLSVCNMDQCTVYFLLTFQRSSILSIPITKSYLFLANVALRSYDVQQFAQCLALCIGNRMNASAFRDLWARLMF